MESKGFVAKTKPVLGVRVKGGRVRGQGVFVLPYLSYNISYLKKVMDKCLRISYMINHVTLHPGGNSVEFVRNPCSARPSA